MTSLATAPESASASASASAAASASGTTHTLERALAILRAFDGRTAPVTHSEIVKRTGYSKASVSRIAYTLVSLGYLARDVDGVRFRMGVRGRMLGHTYRANSPVSAIARPIMQAFADRHDMSMALGIGDGTEMLYLEYAKSPGTSTLCFSVGKRLKMEVSALGRAYLWGLPEAERRRLLERIADRGKASTAGALERTELAFGKLASEGWCLAAGEYQRETYGIAVPVRLGSPALPMSLSCAAMLPVRDEREIRETIVPALKATAERLRSSLAGVDSELF
ncbi:IclR family transcriptional regulator [Ramlibacter sp.]|uniref:IclR family transcriptional regulator n=1 Tax=Ramlibacter sp. TaxID=1917967 RepID=UPI003D0C1622